MSENKLSTPPKPVDIEERIRQARQSLESCFKDFHKLISDKVLTKNKSNAVKMTEKSIVDRLVNACTKLETLNMGEGIISISVIALREHLRSRDLRNELEYELGLVKRELNHLKKTIKDIQVNKEKAIIKDE